MDFVVVGFGVGTLGVLLGVIVLGWLAGRAERSAANAAAPAAAAYDRAAAAEYRGAGQAFIYAGGAVILATIGGLAGALDDRTGALLVATTATVAALGILFWGYFHRSRHPMPPRPRRQTRLTAVSGATPVALLDRAVPSSRPGETAGAPVTAIVSPDATDQVSDTGPVTALNGDHDVAADATANEPAIQSGIDTASAHQIEPEASAPDPVDPPPGGESEAAPREDSENEPPHATGDATAGEETRVTASVAPMSGADAAGPEFRKP